MANRLETSTRHYDEQLQQILKTSAKIFAEKGFHRTSIRDIARATGMSLAGLYSRRCRAWREVEGSISVPPPFPSSE